jgi:hypothetical protein
MSFIQNYYIRTGHIIQYSSQNFSMKPLFISFILLFLSTLNTSIYAQTVGEKHATMSDDEMDSLIDSLLMEKEKTASELNIGISFQNRTLFAGRDLGIKQWNSVINASYYHWSGLYADVSGFMYGKSDPKLQITSLSAGYIGDISENLSIMADIGKMIETNPDPNFPNQLPYWTSLSLSYNIDKFMPTADYTLLFGDETAKRLRLGVSYYKSFKKIGFLDRISLSSKVSTTFGNQDITYAQYWTGGNLYASDSTSLTQRNPFNQRLTKLRNRLQALQNTTQSYFGLMAVDFSVGISAIKDNFRLTFTPHLIKPIRLYTGEDISVGWQFYVGVSCGYTFRGNR